MAKKEVKAVVVPLSSIKPNPSNPRTLRDEKFLKLRKSLEDFPDMLNYRAIVAVTDTDGKYMVLGGNMRLRALQDLKVKDVPVMLADHWTEEQRREFIGRAPHFRWGGRRFDSDPGAQCIIGLTSDAKG